MVDLYLIAGRTAPKDSLLLHQLQLSYKLLYHAIEPCGYRGTTNSRRKSYILQQACSARLLPSRVRQSAPGSSIRDISTGRRVAAA
eukprot:2489641-Rhodomonas_salina.1